MLTWQWRLSHVYNINKGQFPIKMPFIIGFPVVMFDYHSAPMRSHVNTTRHLPWARWWQYHASRIDWCPKVHDHPERKCSRARNFRPQRAEPRPIPLIQIPLSHPVFILWELWLWHHQSWDHSWKCLWELWLSMVYNCTSPSGIYENWHVLHSQLSPRIPSCCRAAALHRQTAWAPNRWSSGAPWRSGSILQPVRKAGAIYGYRELMELPNYPGVHIKKLQITENPQKCQLLVVPIPSFEGLQSHVIWLLPCFCTLYLSLSYGSAPIFPSYPTPCPASPGTEISAQLAGTGHSMMPLTEASTPSMFICTTLSPGTGMHWDALGCTGHKKTAENHGIKKMVVLNPSTFWCSMGWKKNKCSVEEWIGVKKM